MTKIKVVTAYVDLGLTKRPSEDFHRNGRSLLEACHYGDIPVRAFMDFQFSRCWAVEKFRNYYPPANARAEDRFIDEDEHRRSNLIQHSPMQWLAEAAAEDPVPDVFVWLGYSLLKQGDFTGKRVTPADVCAFAHKVGEYAFADIPIPSIRPQDPVVPYGDNWQFVGSTIIAPRAFLPRIERSYRAGLMNFVLKYKAIPLDLAIWPAVVENSGLPWRPYPAEYDATQLTNFPG